MRDLEWVAEEGDDQLQLWSQKAALRAVVNPTNPLLVNFSRKRPNRTLEELLLELIICKGHRYVNGCRYYTQMVKIMWYTAELSPSRTKVIPPTAKSVGGFQLQLSTESYSRTYFWLKRASLLLWVQPK